MYNIDRFHIWNTLFVCLFSKQIWSYRAKTTILAKINLNFEYKPDTKMIVRDRFEVKSSISEFWSDRIYYEYEQDRGILEEMFNIEISIPKYTE